MAGRRTNPSEGILHGMPLESYLAENRQRHLTELLDFLRIPSVSADPRHAADVRRAAEFLREKFAALGLACEIHETPGHPVVLAERRVSPEAPTVLVYGHYDVQPPDPLELWQRPPFEPTIVDDAIVARGASDDKGQVYAHVKAAEALLAAEPDAELNLVFLVEGEEEVSSTNLGPFVEANRERLKADVVLISDGAMLGPHQPSLNYGLRGISYVEVRVRAADRDLHSGAYGGAVPNAIDALARMIAGLHDEQGRVTVPGFYDKVQAIDEQERRALSELPFDEERFLSNVGVTASPGEAGYSLVERIWTRPTLDVNGIGGGFQGEGSKTVIAAEAMAKISCRLVPNQDPSEITRLLGEHLERIAPAGVEVEVIDLHGGWPAVMPLDAPALITAGEAVEAVWGKRPVFVRTGGSIPVVSLFQQLLEADVVMLDMGLETDRVHAPNERFELENYYRGIRVSAELLRRLASR
jgi:acetylornithine deacetylase/succinyl-diaminopimelate desuccinylase-like protein